MRRRRAGQRRSQRGAEAHTREDFRRGAARVGFTLRPWDDEHTTASAPNHAGKRKRKRNPPSCHADGYPAGRGLGHAGSCTRGCSNGCETPRGREAKTA